MFLKGLPLRHDWKSPLCLLAAAWLQFTAMPLSAQSIEVGSLSLKRCAALRDGPPRGYCGRMQRPLDPANPQGEKISIYFEYFRHTAPGRTFGVLVAAEGGPGYPSTLSRDDYYALYAPLKDRNDLLLMDNRGTGQSGAVNCPGLQTADRIGVDTVGECGRLLGSKAPLYSTAYAADDLAAILEALRLPKIDLYGDSYGTYFAQVFAIRHGARLRSVVLDGAYPLNGPDYAWYPNYAPAMREKFNVACARAPHCARLPGDSIAHILPALQRLRAAPRAASAADADGNIRRFQASAAMLATVMFSSAPAYATLRETDAAARSFAAGDEAPLLRLMAESSAGVDSRDAANDPSRWSAGLAAAVMCQDPPQVFDMNLPMAQRREQFEQRSAERANQQPLAYSPFTLKEYRGLPLDYSYIEQCLEWPAADQQHPAGAAGPADAAYPDVPVLVISGEFDNITSVNEGAAAARAFPQGRHVILANSFHVNALSRARADCAAGIVRRFISTLTPGDTSCAWQVPELPLAPDFALNAATVEPATVRAGDDPGNDRRRCAAAALYTAADVLTRVRSNSSGHGVGLRGGSFSVAGNDQEVTITLSEARWTQDLPVSGTLLWKGHRAPVSASLQWNSPATVCPSGELQVQWPQLTANARASIRGTVAGRLVDAELPAP